MTAARTSHTLHTIGRILSAEPAGGLSDRELLRRLAWSAGSVKGRLERARELLRLRLERRGIALSAGLAGVALAGSARAALSPGLRAAVIAAALGRGAGASVRVIALAGAAGRAR